MLKDVALAGALPHLNAGVAWIQSGRAVDGFGL